MIAGGRLLAGDGKQVAVFPALAMNTTQGAGGYYSHLCSFASDNAAPVGQKKIYAPCDMKLVSKDMSWANGYTVIFQTVEPVYTAAFGLSHFTLVLTHADDISWLVIGKVYKQGQHIYDEGNSGNVTGTHVHMNVAKGHQTGLINTPCPNSQFPIWQLPEGVYVDEIFYDNLTQIINVNVNDASLQGWRNYKFKTFEGGTTPDPDPDPSGDSDILTHMMCKTLPNFF